LRRPRGRGRRALLLAECALLPPRAVSPAVVRVRLDGAVRDAMFTYVPSARAEFTQGVLDRVDEYTKGDGEHLSDAQKRLLRDPVARRDISAAWLLAHEDDFELIANEDVGDAGGADGDEPKRTSANPPEP